MISMKMSDGGRVVIPAEIRRQLALKDGDTILWEIKDGMAILTTRQAQCHQAQAMVQRFVPASVSLADELIAERRAESTAEQAQP